MITKTYSGTPARTNAQGDTTISFPGGAFPNELVAVQVNAGPIQAGAFTWLPFNPTLSGVSLRCYRTGSATAVPSASLHATVIAIGR